MNNQLINKDRPRCYEPLCRVHFLANDKPVLEYGDCYLMYKMQALFIRQIEAP